VSPQPYLENHASLQKKSAQNHDDGAYSSRTYPFSFLMIMTPGSRVEREIIMVRPELKSAITAVVQTQIDSNDPPETKQAFDRLISEGHSVAEAIDLLGCVVVAEVFEVLSKGEVFDIERYVDALSRLPEIPG